MKIFAKTIEPEAVEQINKMAKSPVGGDAAHIRIMPDAHAGTGCVIGTTMRITDKVCPNLVGVDIGCGVDLVKTDIDFNSRLDELDSVIRAYVPCGMATHPTPQDYDFTDLRCWQYLKKDTQELAQTALGTLGGGNHFIEAYDGGELAVHSGSRNIGWRVAEYYQNLAIKHCNHNLYKKQLEILKTIEPKQRQQWLNEHKITVDKELCYLEGDDMQDYLHDVAVMQRFANANRLSMLRTITEKMGGKIISHINSIHNYIDVDNMILRKGAISAQKDEILVIPLNMRDGILVCKGKGNPDWNFSAPHGAGRLYSRAKAKSLFTVDEYAQSMQGIYTTCVNEDTLDEAPFAYKDYKEIMSCIEPTVEILDRLIPIYNFKAN